MTLQQYKGAIHKAVMHRHRDDIIIPEAMCAKDTEKPDAGVTPMRLDYWVVACSWSRSSYTGYEVKVSRQDFLGDKKTHHYQRQCTTFVWVTAPGVVQDISEIPDDHGWQEISKNGARLITRKKARRLEPNPAAIFNALKSSYMRQMRPEQVIDKREYFRQWLINREINRSLGHRTSKAIKETIEKRILAVESENHQLRMENERLGEIQRLLEHHKVKAYTTTSAAQQLIQAAEAEAMGIPVGLMSLVRRKGQELLNIADQLQDIKKAFQDSAAKRGE